MQNARRIPEKKVSRFFASRTGLCLRILKEIWKLSRCDQEKDFLNSENPPGLRPPLLAVMQGGESCP